MTGAPREPLSAGWDALARMSWAEARVSFEEAMAVRASAEALEGLSLAAWWLDDAPAMFGARERAYALYQRRRWSSYAAVSSSPIEAGPFAPRHERDREGYAASAIGSLRVLRIAVSPPQPQFAG